MKAGKELVQVFRILFKKKKNSYCKFFVQNEVFFKFI